MKKHILLSALSLSFLTVSVGSIVNTSIILTKDAKEKMSVKEQTGKNNNIVLSNVNFFNKNKFFVKSNNAARENFYMRADTGAVLGEDVKITHDSDNIKINELNVKYYDNHFIGDIKSREEKIKNNIKFNIDFNNFSLTTGIGDPGKFDIKGNNNDFSFINNTLARNSQEKKPNKNISNIFENVSFLSNWISLKSYNEIISMNNEVVLKWERSGGYRGKYDRGKFLISSKINNSQISLDIHMFGNDIADLNTPSYSEVFASLRQGNGIKTDAILPYSENDLAEFQQVIQNIFDQQIILNDSNSPIIFDRDDFNTENEVKVKNVINQRIENYFAFYGDDRLKDKIGDITKENIDISLQIPEKNRGVAGVVWSTIRFKIKNGKFKLDKGNKNPVEYIDIRFQIKVNLAPDVNHEVQDLINIIPYQSSSNVFKEREVKSEYNEKDNLLSNNEPLNNILNNFKFDLNQPNQAGKEKRLIPVEKFASIRKSGTRIQLNLSITDDFGNVLTPNLKADFNRVFTNGKMFYDLNVAPFKINDNGTEYLVNFVDNKITLGLELKDGKINLFNVRKMALETKLPKQIIKKINFRVSSATATIPLDQYKSESKWTQIGDMILPDAHPDGIFYQGKWETQDPFIFEMINQTIPIYDTNTGELIKDVAQYQPVIINATTDEGTKESGDGNNIYPSPFDGRFVVNLGNHIMKMKNSSGLVDIKIRINEYDRKTSSYSKAVYEIDVKLNLVASQATFQFPLWTDNELITDAERAKYFDPKNEETYRGDVVSEETGLYKPRLVWVNALPPESFLYDPKGKDDKVLEGLGEGEEHIDPNWEIGYIAELNASGFEDGDFASLATMGGYTIEFNKEEFKPNGIVPYSEYYEFNKNSDIPTIDRGPLTNSGHGYTKPGMRQVVLNKPGSNIYLYQFMKIPKSLSNDGVFEKDLINLYGNLKGISGKNLFIDFWETSQARHLVDYMIQNGLANSIDDVKALPYHQIVQYWSLYVNNPEFYDNDIDGNVNSSEYDIKKLVFKKQFTKSNDYNELSNIVRMFINQELNKAIKKEDWIQENENLLEGIDYRIESNQSDFENKVRTMISNFDRPLAEAKSVSFNIEMTRNNDNEIIKIVGKNTIDFLNNKDIDNIVNFDNFSATKLNMNTEIPPYNVPNKKTLIKNKIKEEINNDIELAFINSGINYSPDTLPKENIDYRIEYVARILNDETHIIEERVLNSIEDAIDQILLFNADTKEFNNYLYINVISLDSSQNLIRGTFRKIVNNSHLNTNTDSFPPVNMNDFKKETLKINTEHDDFPKDETKIEIIKTLIEKQINQIILLNSRRRIDLTGEVPILGQDYEIKYLKKSNLNIVEYYDTYQEAIQNELLFDVDTNDKFNNKLSVEIRVIENDFRTTLSGRFNYDVNNSYLNEAIEDENWLDDNLVVNPDENGDDKLPGQVIPDENQDILWWILTPVTIVVLLTIIGVTIVVIRKNRNIR